MTYLAQFYKQFGIPEKHATLRRTTTAPAAIDPKSKASIEETRRKAKELLESRQKGDSASSASAAAAVPKQEAKAGVESEHGAAPAETGHRRALARSTSVAVASRPPMFRPPKESTKEVTPHAEKEEEKGPKAPKQDNSKVRIDHPLF